FWSVDPSEITPIILQPRRPRRSIEHAIATRPCYCSRNIPEIRMADTEKLALVATVAANYLRRNPVGVDQIGTVFAAVTRALEDAARRLEGGAASEAGAEAAPAVPIRRSIKPDHLICLECGKSATTLKRHLQAAHGMTPQQYRDRWVLKP